MFTSSPTHIPTAAALSLRCFDLCNFRNWLRAILGTCELIMHDTFKRFTHDDCQDEIKMRVKCGEEVSTQWIRST